MLDTFGIRTQTFKENGLFFHGVYGFGHFIFHAMADDFDKEKISPRLVPNRP